MADAIRTLPDYENPPVIETYLGVQFPPLIEFSIPHFGLYWSKVRGDYPEVQVQPPLGLVIEQFGSGTFVQPRVGVEVVTVPEIRCWFIEKSRTMLTQLQRDRFIHNWRKLKPDDVYVHYDRIKPKFVEEWKRFCLFLDEAGLGKPDVNQCEMTYVNHIELGQGWNSYAELNNVIAPWSGVYSGDFLPAAESLTIGARYVLPGKRGRLHIQMQPAITQDGKEILQLNLTARGTPKSISLEDILEWFDLGHEWIVRGFTDFTRKEMHTIWRRKL